MRTKDNSKTRTARILVLDNICDALTLDTITGNLVCVQTGKSCGYNIVEDCPDFQEIKLKAERQYKGGQD